ncbi:MAG: GNAT family N-acetyltransferase [Acidobacteria bacterium]|nr:GNAT family N-acetyltransferase [Acidobacteriota bacterium]
MVDSEVQLDAADFDRMAWLHVDSIDDSLPALLGVGFSDRLYRFLARSPDETLFPERVDGRIESVCVLSFAPASLHGRILRGTLPVLVLHALSAFVMRPDFRTFLRRSVAEARRDVESPAAPEITYIFTNGRLRGHGLGARLLARVETYLRDRGETACFVKTLDTADNRAIAFYEENGFAPIGTRAEAGRRFVQFQKPIPGSDRLPKS